MEGTLLHKCKGLDRICIVYSSPVCSQNIEAAVKLLFCCIFRILFETLLNSAPPQRHPIRRSNGGGGGGGLKEEKENGQADYGKNNG